MWRVLGFLLFSVVSAMLFVGCASDSKNLKVSSDDGPTVCYKIDFCAVSLLVMNADIEAIRRTTGEYPGFTREAHEHNGTACNSLPFRYSVVSGNGATFPVCADDTAHEGFHVVVYGSGKMALVPQDDYDEFVQELADGRLTIKTNWKDSLREVYRNR